MKILRWIDKNFEEIQGIVLTIVMVVIMGCQVIARYVFNNSLSWSEALARYIFIWLGFISISYCVKKNSSIRVVVLLELMPKRMQRAFAYLEDVIVLAFYCFMTKAAWAYLMASINSGQTSPALGVPMWTIQCAPFIGFVLVVIRRLQNIILRALGKTEDGKEEIA